MKEEKPVRSCRKRDTDYAFEPEIGPGYGEVNRDNVEGPRKKRAHELEDQDSEDGEWEELEEQHSEDDEWDESEDQDPEDDEF